ncbi:carbon starvation CstA family protein [Solibacillus sp. FSL W7-1436]|uniref:carbon starvation CstA family protein n=1 Tax=Solibacillus sp. FSL W7-1436 TaxID=2921705 RepID=UPI0030F8E9C1
MYTLLGSITLLIVGYIVYGKFIEKVFIVNDATPTPAYTKADNLDYMPMPAWKGWTIQLLNIAGLGPIYGAIAGALYGPVAMIWIVFGCIFAGAVHDYFAGMLSLRHGGAQFPALVQRYLGKVMRVFTDIVSVVLMVLVAAAFTAGPAAVLSSKLGITFMTALIAIFIYFLLAAILPINQIIGRIYPLFGAVLIIMAGAVLVSLVTSGIAIPEVSLSNMHPNDLPVWPLLMITISCGAISGFHSTQSPIVSRTIKKESEGRKVFFGAMIGEGVIALIWCAAGMSFYGGTEGLLPKISEIGAGGVVDEISIALLGTFGSILAILGIVILPITTGDTSLRSARMIVLDFLGSRFSKNSTTPILATVAVAAPAFFLSTIDYQFLWRYVGMTNQMVATVMLWVATSYLLKSGKFHWLAGLPALFMTSVVFVYLMVAPEGFALAYETGVVIGLSFTVLVSFIYIYQIFKHKAFANPVFLTEK